MNSLFYLTKIIHKRLKPFNHKFQYTSLTMCLDYDEIKKISKNVKIFSYNKFNIFSFYDEDHGYRDKRTLEEFVKNFLTKHEIHYKNLKIKILCFPRILGYVFNPLSVIYCYNDENLISIFYEVKNTSNEQHTYFFASKEVKNKKEYKHQCNKSFYVSPFIEMKGVYKFTNSISDEKLSIIIDLFSEKNEKIFTASQFGNKVPLCSMTLIKQLIFNPLVTFKVIFAILYEALIIFIKGGKYYSREKKIIDSITYEGKL